jgi:hypothetical protein
MVAGRDDLKILVATEHPFDTIRCLGRDRLGLLPVSLWLLLQYRILLLMKTRDIMKILLAIATEQKKLECTYPFCKDQFLLYCK